MTEGQKKVKCGCGRSQTDYCTGLHRLDESEYTAWLKRQKESEYRAWLERQKENDAYNDEHNVD